MCLHTIPPMSSAAKMMISQVSLRAGGGRRNVFVDLAIPVTSDFLAGEWTGILFLGKAVLC